MSRVPIDLDKLADALNVPRDFLDLRLDGRALGLLAEISLGYSFFASLAQRGHVYDATSSDGRRWEVRGCSARGVSFAPSKCLGAGRAFSTDLFLDKVAQLDGYLVFDAVDPALPFWSLSRETVAAWWGLGLLGKNAKVSRTKFLALVEDL